MCDSQKQRLLIISRYASQYYCTFVPVVEGHGGRPPRWMSCPKEIIVTLREVTL